jgi:hypothetical protein
MGSSIALDASGQPSTKPEHAAAVTAAQDPGGGPGESLHAVAISQLSQSSKSLTVAVQLASAGEPCASSEAQSAWLVGPVSENEVVQLMVLS